MPYIKYTLYKKAILNLGIFRKEDNKMVGVLQWGCSFQEKIRLDRYVKEPIEKTVLILKLCLDYSARGLKLLKT